MALLHGNSGRCDPNASEDQQVGEGKSNIITEIRGTIMTIGINRPEVRNAVDQETARLLLDAFRAFEGDPSLTVAVLHGL
ncbi:3-hydroxyisobutyryl-CoA hydrolase 1, partial [Varanus komodoensis]